jgi:hypothetical protein
LFVFLLILELNPLNDILFQHHGLPFDLASSQTAHRIFSEDNCYLFKGDVVHSGHNGRLNFARGYSFEFSVFSLDALKRAWQVHSVVLAVRFFMQVPDKVLHHG